MSEVLIKTAAFDSANGAIVRQIVASSRIVTLTTPAYSRTIILKKENPVKNFDDKYSYVRIDAQEPVEVIFDGKSFITGFFEIVVAQAKSLTIKYHGNTEIAFTAVLGA